MLARLGKTLSTNAAVGGLALLVLGAGGTTATLVAGHSPTPTPNAHANANATEHPSDDASEAPDPAESESPDGTRPTDTHGYCVSQVAQAATTSTDPGAHGKAVSAAAHACGKNGSPTSGAKTKHGKAFGKNHGTGRPSAVTPGAPAQP